MLHKIKEKQAKTHTSPTISAEIRGHIYREWKKRKSLELLAVENRLPYHTILTIINSYQKTVKTITKEELTEIRKMVLAGIPKKRISELTGIPPSTVRRLTRDISFKGSIPYLIQRLIYWECRYAGKSKRQIADELGVSLRSVILYSKKRISPQTLLTDMPSKPKYRAPRIPAHIIDRIRKEVLGGKPKIQVAREFGIHHQVVYNHTKDITTGKVRNLGIAGDTLVFLEDLMKHGYDTLPISRKSVHYTKLKKHFPNIRHVQRGGQSIYFLQETADLAMRVFLEKKVKKQLSYQELQAIIKVFSGKMDKKEKKRFV